VEEENNHQPSDLAFMDLSIIILSHNSKQDLERLLPSVFGSEGISFDKIDPSTSSGTNFVGEVIVVDNGSSDGTLDWLKAKNYQLKAVGNQNNGFAAGNNLGIRSSSGKYILLLNPDTEVETGTFEMMLKFMDDHPEIGISGCKVVKGDGKLDLACRRRFPNPWNSFKRLFLLSNQDYNYTDTDENKSMEVDSVMGAFLLIRKTVIDQIGLLDEKFFMYGEDLDWCWRCKEAGFKVWYYPATSITHYKGSSSSKIPFKALQWFHQAMWIFYKKHYKNKYPFFLNWLVWLGVYFRFVVLVIVNVFKRNPTVSK